MNNFKMDLKKALSDWQLTSHRIKQLKESLSLEQEILDTLENATIPGILQDNGVAGTFTTDFGFQIKLEDYLHASIAGKPEKEYERSQEYEENKVKAYSWLESVGYGGIIKQDLEFDRGTDISPLLDIAEEKGLTYKKKLEAHWKSVDKAIRELREMDEEIPSVFVVQSFKKASIKVVKE